jgi:hypothetical protein
MYDVHNAIDYIEQNKIEVYLFINLLNDDTYSKI